MATVLLTPLLANFRRRQNELQEFGAADTEPRAELARLMTCAARGLDAGRHSWELYSTMKGHGAAARKLDSAVRPLLKAIAQLRETRGEGVAVDTVEAMVGRYFGQLTWTQAS